LSDGASMRPNTRMLSFLGAAALLAAALVGAASTTWYEALSASASVDTASLDATISCASPLTEVDPDTAVTPTSSAGSSHGWLLGASGVYPGYEVTCSYTIANPDQTPWHLESIGFSVTSASGTTNGTCTLGGNCTWTGSYFTVTFPDDRGCQVHQGEDVTGSFTITGTDAPVAAGDTGPYHVAVSFGVHQWNESAYSSCGTVKP